ncbi:MAG: AAA family ATPase [Clostridia bacterium]|nr:AAA family ATPase [Clostridia bacterium]
MKMKHNSILQFEYYSSVKQRKIDWLWYPYIPFGKLTILQGDPGEGKSTFILAIAALLTRRNAMPDGYPIDNCQNVIYQTAEDNIADTVKPRLVAARADCSRVAYIVDEDVTLNFDDPRIEECIMQTNAKLLILDPLQAYLVQDTDMNNAGRMRQQLKKIADLAAKYNCAVVIVGHMNKTSSEKNLYRGLGSIDITAIARSVLMISRDKTDSSIRYMFPVKSSLAPEGSSIAFRLDKKYGVKWLDNYTPTNNEQEKYTIDKSKQSLAERVISEMLEEYDIRSKDILNKLKVMGISERTANGAKSRLGITSYRKDGVWYWHLDDNSDEKERRNVRQ